jgi:hypothetical protein
MYIVIGVLIPFDISYVVGCSRTVGLLPTLNTVISACEFQWSVVLVVE